SRGKIFYCLSLLIQRRCSFEVNAQSKLHIIHDKLKFKRIVASYHFCHSRAQNLELTIPTRRISRSDCPPDKTLPADATRQCRCSRRSAPVLLADRYMTLLR